MPAQACQGGPSFLLWEARSRKTPSTPGHLYRSRRPRRDQTLWSHSSTQMPVPAKSLKGPPNRPAILFSSSPPLRMRVSDTRPRRMVRHPPAHAYSSFASLFEELTGCQDLVRPPRPQRWCPNSAVDQAQLRCQQLRCGVARLGGVGADDAPTTAADLCARLDARGARRAVGGGEPLRPPGQHGISALGRVQFALQRVTILPAGHPAVCSEVTLFARSVDVRSSAAAGGSKCTATPASARRTVSASRSISSTPAPAGSRWHTPG